MIKSKFEYRIYELKPTEVHVPSQDYYARNGESTSEDLIVLTPIYLENNPIFFDLESAISAISAIGDAGTYTALPVIIKQR